MLYTAIANNYTIEDWVSIGTVELSHAERSMRLHFRHQDAISGQMIVRWRDIDPPAWGEEPSTVAECGELEPHVIWRAPTHAQRLSEHRAGQPDTVLKDFAINLDKAERAEWGQPSEPISSEPLAPVTQDLSEIPAIEPRQPPYSHLTKSDNEYVLTMACGGLPVDSAVFEAGHEPNGYFWEAVVTFSAPDLAQRVELVSEAGAFVANCSKRDLSKVQARLDAMVLDPVGVSALIRAAEASDFEFDD